MLVKTKTLRGYLQGISGLFISKDNPGGLTPKELDMLTAFLFILSQDDKGEIDASVKEKVASLTNHPPQVITNYVKRLRDKNVFTLSNKPHPILLETKIELEKP